MTRTADEIATLAWIDDVAARFRTAARPLAVVYADQQWSARPRLPYATVLKLSESTIGEGEVYNLDESSTSAVERVGWMFEGTFSVSFYGDTHNQLAQDLLLSIRSDAQIDANAARGVTVVDVVSGPRRLSTNTNSVTEDRTVVDVRVRYWRERETAGVGIIENLDLTYNP